MARLTERVKRFLVGELATFSTPSEAAESVQEHFGIEVTRQQVEHYDPTKVTGHNLAQPLRDLFWELRKAYRERTDDIPIANKAYRLDQLQRMYRAALRAFEQSESRGGRVNLPMLQAMQELLERAAKEAGDAYSNRRIFSGVIGSQDLSAMTDEQLVMLAEGEPLEKVLAA